MGVRLDPDVSNNTIGAIKPNRVWSIDDLSPCSFQGADDLRLAFVYGGHRGMSPPR
jgi:hypothetical protein